MYGQGDSNVFNYNQGRTGQRLKGFNESIQQPKKASLHISKDVNRSEVFSEK